VLRWIVRSLAGLDLATGAIPLVALVLLTLPRATPRRPAERAFLSVAWASLGWFLVVGGLSGNWEPFGLKERYLFYVEPLLLLALVLWVELGPARRLRVVLGAAAVLALCVAFLPLGSLLTAPSLPGNALGMEVFRRIGNATGFGWGLKAMLVGAVLAVPLVAAGLARRRVVALAFVGVFIAVSAAFAARIADDQARAVAATAMRPADRSWVDAAVGKDANVTLLNTSNFMPETVRQEIFPVFAPWWETQFWNRSARSVDSLGSPEPLPLAQGSGKLDWASGIVSGVQRASTLSSTRASRWSAGAAPRRARSSSTAAFTRRSVSLRRSRASSATARALPTRRTTAGRSARAPLRSRSCGRMMRLRSACTYGRARSPAARQWRA
jgi:hypothetical protein